MRNKPIELKCSVCGKLILIHISRIRNGRGKYCSNLCKRNGTRHTAKRHANIINGVHRFEYQIIAERALGRSLKYGEVIHHIDGDAKNNLNNNLVICNQDLHLLIHAKYRALKESGNSLYRKCVYCRNWDDLSNMIKHSRSSFRHKWCYYKRSN